MSPTSRDETVAAKKWTKYQRAAIRRRARRFCWISVAAETTERINELSRQPKRPRGVHRELQNAEMDQAVELRKIAIERAQLEGARRGELLLAMPISQTLAARLMRRSDELLRERENRIWRKVCERNLQKKRSADALARGRTSSGYELPRAD